VNPHPVDSEEAKHQVFAFDQPPAIKQAAEFADVQLFKYKDTLLAEMARMWLDRARFLCWMRRAVTTVRPDTFKVEEFCEVCKKGVPDVSLSCVPARTLLSLGGEFRRQRDMAVTMQETLWRTFYKKATNMCTVCTQCYVYHWSRNIDIDIDKYRKDRIEQVSVNPLNILAESQFEACAISEDAGACLNVWWNMAQRFRKGEDWKEVRFLFSKF